MSAEMWHPIPGLEGRYEVSSLGRVRSLLRKRIMRQWLKSAGYFTVCLYGKGGEKRTHMVHQLVAIAFHGPRPAGHVVCHNDGDSTNNLAENLRWDTPSENLRDRVRHGTDRNASKVHCVAGHPFTPANTYTYRGGRYCRPCRAARAVRYRAEQKAAAS